MEVKLNAYVQHIQELLTEDNVRRTYIYISIYTNKAEEFVNKRCSNQKCQPIKSFHGRSRCGKLVHIEIVIFFFTNFRDLFCHRIINKHLYWLCTVSELFKK